MEERTCQKQADHPNERVRQGGQEAKDNSAGATELHGRDRSSFGPLHLKPSTPQSCTLWKSDPKINKIKTRGQVQRMCQNTGGANIIPCWHYVPQA